MIAPHLQLAFVPILIFNPGQLKHQHDAKRLEAGTLSMLVTRFEVALCESEIALHRGAGFDAVSVKNGHHD